MDRLCTGCEGVLTTRKQKKYCSNKCQGDHEYRLYIAEWLLGNRSGEQSEGEVSNHVRRWLFALYDSKCQRCGWNSINPVTERVPLTVNHIDGDWACHRPDNLELLCPNCHSLTPNYGSLNRGKGRKNRLAKIHADKEKARN